MIDHPRGQMTIEMMLLIVALLTVSLIASKTARAEAWMKTLVSGPWKPLQAMIEDGVWKISDSKAMHPHHRYRHGSYEADRLEGDSGGDDGGFE